MSPWLNLKAVFSEAIYAKKANKARLQGSGIGG